jgi:hypothetical protein
MDNVANASTDWIVYGRETSHGTRYGLMNNAGADTGAQFRDAGAAQAFATSGIDADAAAMLKGLAYV